MQAGDMSNFLAIERVFPCVLLALIGCLLVRRVHNVDGKMADEAEHTQHQEDNRNVV